MGEASFPPDVPILRFQRRHLDDMVLIWLAAQPPILPHYDFVCKCRLSLEIDAAAAFERLIDPQPFGYR